MECDFGDCGGPAITEIGLASPSWLRSSDRRRSCPILSQKPPTSSNRWEFSGKGRENLVGKWEADWISGKPASVRMAARGLEDFSRLLEPAPSVTNTSSPHRGTVIPVSTLIHNRKSGRSGAVWQPGTCDT